jgi:hypothetical protein
VERCLACKAVGVATRGALPRLRGRGEQRFDGPDMSHDLTALSRVCRGKSRDIERRETLGIHRYAPLLTTAS